MPGERIGNSNQYLTISGVVSAPAYSWASDNNTGLYRIGADNIGVAANGAKVLDIATTGLTVTGAFASSNGVSSTLTTDATSSTTGSIITAGGISTQKALFVGTTSRLVGNVQADANVLIGTSTNYSPFAVNFANPTGSSGNGVLATFRNSQTGGTNTGAFLAFETGGTYSWTHGLVGASGNSLVWNAGGTTERMRLDLNGNLGIGMTPARTLDVTGTFGVTGASTLGGALTYGGVTLSNSVTGTGSMVLSAGPTLTGTAAGQTNNAASETAWTVLNNSASNGAFAILRGSNGTSSVDFGMTGTGYAGVGSYTANQAYVRCDAANGFGIYAPTGPIKFNANGFSEVARFVTSGNFGIGLTNPNGYRLNLYSTAALNCGSAGAANMFLVYATGTPGSAGWNGANSICLISKDTGTSRSLNASGTINASGADYAEYMTKADGCDLIAKGAIAGVDADGKLTDKFADAHSFVVKSTNPSYVGGDTWASEIEWVGPLKDGATDKEIAAKKNHADAIEKARQTVDRIAFSGQVPVNVTGATVGDYIVPVAGPDGGIAGEAVTNPTFDQYRAAVGRVWKILEDGRAFVSVKVS